MRAIRGYHPSYRKLLWIFADWLMKQSSTVPPINPYSGLWPRLSESGLWYVRLVVLVSFVATSIGIPLGDWSPKQTAAGVSLSPWCRCSVSAKKSGKCCCSKGSSATTQSSCCSARARTKATSRCCAGKTNAACATMTATSTSNNDAPAWRSSCLCGPTDAPMLLVCAEPRILNETVSTSASNETCGRWIATSCSTCGQRPQPLVPPPETPLLG